MHLKSHVRPMYQLYEAIKDRGGDPTEEEKAVASGETTLSADEMVKFLQGLQKPNASIAAAFVKQVEKAKAGLSFHKSAFASF